MISWLYTSWMQSLTQFCWSTETETCKLILGTAPELLMILSPAREDVIVERGYCLKPRNSATPAGLWVAPWSRMLQSTEDRGSTWSYWRLSGIHISPKMRFNQKELAGVGMEPSKYFTKEGPLYMKVNAGGWRKKGLGNYFKWPLRSAFIHSCTVGCRGSPCPVGVEVCSRALSLISHTHPHTQSIICKA